MQTGKQASTEADIMTGRRARRQASIHVDPSFSCPDYNTQMHRKKHTGRQADQQTGKGRRMCEGDDISADSNRKAH